MAVLNLIISLTPGIDGWGHAGGLVGGVLMAFAIGPQLVLVRRGPWAGAMPQADLRVMDPTSAMPEAYPMALDDGELPMRLPFGLADARPPSQRTWTAVGAAILLIFGATWVMTQMAIWARPALQ